MRILIADDDPDTRALVARALDQEFAGADIVGIRDPDSLEAALRDGAPDILVTDYQLQWTDGFRIHERVRGRFPHCCCVMFTGTGSEEVAVQAMKRGFDDYVVKRPEQLKRLAAGTSAAYARTRQRKELADNRDLVLRELYHRLHNNLQIVISLIRLTAKAVADAGAKEQLADLGRRIQALSELQEQFFRSPDFRQVDFSSFVERLARGLVELAGGRIGPELELDEARLPVDKAVPLALIANELITNAVKHAFPGERPGRVFVRLRRQEHGLLLEVADDGIGFADGLNSAPSGLGMHLVERLAAQLGAEARFDSRSGGTTCRIALPP